MCCFTIQSPVTQLELQKFPHKLLLVTAVSMIDQPAVMQLVASMLQALQKRGGEVKKEWQLRSQGSSPGRGRELVRAVGTALHLFGWVDPLG